MPLPKEKEDIDMDILRTKELLISLADGVNPVHWRNSTG